MLEVANNKELQVKLKKLCDEQDVYREKVENDCMVNKAKASMKALGNTLKVVAEEDDIETESQLKRTRTAVSSAGGSGSELPSVEESLHHISEALTQSINLLLGIQVASDLQASALHRIERQTANIHFTMQNQIDKVDYRLKRVKRHIKK
ncbi:hypothetical protein M422DRAFT_257564 [Sphaerobolus stellatus SS14]|uniref:Uncharacterized protein n=1 Tax=Sphaerobolus stellatus (strain SS14) TaxID=990650 RepID=A0A0C9VNR8_SPHS4|nr:hypothetical protein M422DRAFT_257564 [Sphaerobolus stellatus SS14]